MKQINLTKKNKNFFIVICFIFCHQCFLFSQSTSYNLNSIPIGGFYSSGFGSGVLQNNTSGDANSAFGWRVLRLNTTGNNNAGVGYAALYSNTSGTGNVAIGASTLFSNTSGALNTAVGLSALYSNASGTDNSAFGFGALYSNTSGAHNLGLGVNTLNNNTIGNNNVAMGSSALNNNINGNNNLSVGSLSTYSNTMGSYNSIVGNNSGYDIQTGNYNSLFGYNTGQGITSGSKNTIIGANVNSLPPNLSNTIILADGDGNQRFYVNSNGDAGIGTTSPTAKLELNSGFSNMSGLKFSQLNSASSTSSNNGKVLSVDASGNVVLTSLTSGVNDWLLSGNSGTIDGTNFIGTTDNVPFNIRVNNQVSGRIDPTKYNTFYGLEAGRDITTGSGYYNTATGTFALQSIANGIYNTANGSQALRANSTGDGNTASGMQALVSNRLGSYNVADGFIALSNNRTGNYNTACGVSALNVNNNGNYNTSIGFSTLHYNTSGSYNTALGSFADFSPSTLDLNNATAIGAQAIVNASNKIRFGDATVTVVEGPVAYTISDGRFKTNINENDVKGLEFINKLRPVVYNFDTKKFEEFLTKDMADSVRTKFFKEKDFTASTAIRQSGFIAQEVEQAAKEAGYNFNGIHVPESKGDNYSLAYSQFVVPLVKSIQELSAQNENMRKEIEELKKLIGNHSTEENTVIKIGTAKLFQNAPNPFNQSTLIKYLIPSTSKKAVLIITSIDGNKLKEYYLSNKIQTLELAASQFASGTYVYSLIVDDVLIDSKLMVLTR